MCSSQRGELKIRSLELKGLTFTWSFLPEANDRMVNVTELSLLSVVVTCTRFLSLGLAFAPRHA